MSTSTNPIARKHSSANAAASAAAASSAVPANMQINETDFLQLISTQLQNQDPLQPTDPSQFLGQLEGLSEVSSLQSMQSAMSSSQLTSGASLLGQSVLAPGTTATLATGGSIAGAVNAPSRRHRSDGVDRKFQRRARHLLPGHAGRFGHDHLLLERRHQHRHHGAGRPVHDQCQRHRQRRLPDGCPDGGQSGSKRHHRSEHSAAGSEYQQRHRAAQFRRHHPVTRHPKPRTRNIKPCHSMSPSRASTPPTRTSR